MAGVTRGLLCTAASTSPYRNLAAEEMLLERLQDGDMVLYLWQNEDTVVIGKNQNAWRECRVEDFEAAGGRVARRLSGGGAVYHDGGNQNFTFLTKSVAYNVAKQTEVIRLAARRFGIEAERSGRNDILADGRKFSGNAFYKSGENHYHHGTILVHSDMGRLGQFLAPSKQKLEAKGVASVRARVVNLRELAPALTCGMMREALAEALAEVYGVPVETRALEKELDAARWDALEAHYAADAWRLGRKKAYNARCFGRLAFGEVELLLEIERGTVAAAHVYTDAMDESWAAPLGVALSGCAATREAVAGVVEAFAEAPAEDMAALAQLVREAWLQEP